MTVVLTMMVRDEADIIAATLEHHLAQGIDRIIVTDNGSIDGTLEILEEYSAVAPVTLLHEAEQRKQQAKVVTRMARMAHDEFGAEWVVNGDADEFLRPRDASLTVREVFERMPVSLGALEVPVVNLVGPMARRGSGIRRLTARDVRSPEQLRAAGVLAHPTPNAIHVGSPDVIVEQGNHATSIEPRGEVPPELALEVLHLPWRSLEQLARKTENMGRGYEASPELRPSSNHHGMRDWRRLQAGVLDEFLALRTPTEAERSGDGFVPETALRDSLEALVGRAVLPERLRASLDDARDDVLSDETVLGMRAAVPALAALEDVLYRQIEAWQFECDALRRDRDGYASSYAEAMERLAAERDDAGVARQAAAAAEQALLEAQRSLELLRLQHERHPLRRARRVAGRALRRLRRR